MTRVLFTSACKGECLYLTTTEAGLWLQETIISPLTLWFEKEVIRNGKSLATFVFFPFFGFAPADGMELVPGNVPSSLSVDTVGIITF